MSGHMKASEICKHEYERWQNFEEESRYWSKVSVTAGAAGTAIGAACLPPAGGCLGILTGGGPAAVAFRYHQMAKDAKQDYETCVEKEYRDKERKNSENNFKKSENMKKSGSETCGTAGNQLEENKQQEANVNQKLQEQEV